jgi:hypothetical protein
LEGPHLPEIMQDSVKSGPFSLTYVPFSGTSLNKQGLGYGRDPTRYWLSLGGTPKVKLRILSGETLR